MLSFITALAYDFKVDGIAYNVVSLPDLTCEVTQSDIEYSGDIAIPSTVTYQGRTLSVIGIEESAFKDCTRLRSVTVPQSVTTIKACTFLNCTLLIYVQLPNTITLIGASAFEGCSQLPSITIPNSVREIGAGAFSECRSLTSIKIPNSVREIWDNGFSGCQSLTSVEIPTSVTIIRNKTFSDCRSLVSIIIPKSVTKIESKAFSNCLLLTSVNIPNSVRYIGERAFIGCHLKSMIWESSIDICVHNSEDYYSSNYPFECTFLEYLKILPSVSKPIAIYPGKLPSLKKLSLGRSLSCDYYDGLRCPNLTELELTGYVESFNIGGRNSVKNLTIDNGVELDAGEYGADMSKYDKLECITMKGDVPQFIPTFANVTYLNAKLRVTKGTLRAYQNAEGWKNFWNIEEHEEEVGIDEVPVEVGAKTECGRYDLQGRPVDDTYRGVTIIRYTDGSAKKVVTTH